MITSRVQKIAEEQQLRQDLQVKLLQSEQQLATLKSSLSNGPSVELIDSPVHSDITPSEFGECVMCEGVRVVFSPSSC